jgi:L-idonate 5-dehydrogenase
MQGVIIHAARDLRVEAIETTPPGPGQVQVRIASGGICGSDLHYFNHGGFGTIRVRQPMALGHEVSGTIAAVGEGVNFRLGQRVAVNPSQPCGSCPPCRAGDINHCQNMYFMGSAMRFPHAQGAFRQVVTVDAEQAFAVPETVSLPEAAMAEPLSVCLHAMGQASTLFGKTVLVTGCGPIGALLVLLASHAGAARIIATDIVDYPLSLARSVGATQTINVATSALELEALASDGGQVDALFEASGNNAALQQALPTLRAKAEIIQVGQGGQMDLPISVIVARELTIRGSFRFGREFGQAVQLLSSRTIDVKPLITHQIGFADATSAFELANRRDQAMKVQLNFA